MDISEFGLTHKNDQFESMISKALPNARQTMATVLPSLNLTSIKSISRQISKTGENEYSVTLRNNSITAANLVRKIQSSNEDIYDVVYSDDLEDNDLIRISEKPLWAVSKVGNTLKIKRVN